MTLRDAIERYVAWRRAHGAKFVGSAGMLHGLCKHVGGNVDCDAVGEAEVLSFLAGNRPLTRYRANKYGALAGFYRYTDAEAPELRVADVVGGRTRPQRLDAGLGEGDVGHGWFSCRQLQPGNRSRDGPLPHGDFDRRTRSRIKQLAPQVRASVFGERRGDHRPPRKASGGNSWPRASGTSARRVLAQSRSVPFLQS